MSLKTNTNLNSAGSILNRLEGAVETPFRAVGAVLGKTPRLAVEGAMVYGGYQAASSGVEHAGNLMSAKIDFGPNAIFDPIAHYGIAGAGVLGGGALMVAGGASALNTAYRAIKEETSSNQA